MLKERVKKLEENINTLGEFSQRFTLEDVKKDKVIQWALKYGVYLCATGIGELACGIVDEKGLGNAKNYKECIAILGDNQILDKSLAEKLISVVGVRDILKRPYIDLDLEKLYSFLDKKDIYYEFVSSLKRNLK